MTLGGLEGLTAWTGISARGIEVWVVRRADAEAARTLIAEQDHALGAVGQEGFGGRGFCALRRVRTHKRVPR